MNKSSSKGPRLSKQASTRGGDKLGQPKNARDPAWLTTFGLEFDAKNSIENLSSTPAHLKTRSRCESAIARACGTYRRLWDFASSFSAVFTVSQAMVD